MKTLNEADRQRRGLRALPWVVALMGAMALGACGTEAAFTIQTDGGTGTDAGTEDVPELPVPTDDVITVTIDPAQAVYRPNTTITPTAQLYLEGTDEPVEGAVFVWSYSPASAAEDHGDGTYTLLAEGPLRIEACVPLPEGLPELGPDDEPYAQTCGYAEIHVDAGPPTVDLTAPLPGEFIEGGSIRVAGTVHETGYSPSLFLNGDEIPINLDGSFETYMTPEFGVNVVEVWANDGVNEREGTDRVEVIWAPYYNAAQGDHPNHFRIPSAIALRLGQDFFDDAIPYVPPVEGTIAETEDLVGIVELLAAELDLLSQIPDPLVDSASEDVTVFMRVTRARLEPPVVEFEITDYGFQFFFHFTDITLYTEGHADIYDRALDLNGSVTAGAAIMLSLKVRKEDITSPLEVALYGGVGEDGEPLPGFAITLENLESNFVSAEANAIFEVAESALRGAVLEQLGPFLEANFMNALPQAIRDLFNQVDESLNFITEVEGTALAIDAAISEIGPSFHTRIDIKVDVDVRTNGEALYSDKPGIPYNGAPGVLPELFEVGRFQIALDLGFINGPLFALWNSGLLQMNVTEMSPEAAVLADDVQVDALLPPLITSGLDGALTITLGQFNFILTKGATTEVWGMHIEANAYVDDSTGEIVITIDEEPRVAGFLMSREGSGTIFRNSGILEDLVTSLVWPELQAAIGEGLAIPLPAIELSSLADMAPTLDDYVVRFALRDRLYSRGNHITIDAMLHGRADLAE